jgi:hypothetical protein
MLTSLLYHAFGIPVYDDIRADNRGGQVTFTMAREPEDCPPGQGPARWPQAALRN